MDFDTPQEATDLRFRLTTTEFANERRVKPESVLKRLCKTGSYFGIKPKKQDNGRHLWPESEGS